MDEKRDGRRFMMALVGLKNWLFPEKQSNTALYFMEKLNMNLFSRSCGKYG